MSEIKNIIFDLGGVLVDLDRKRCADSFARIGFPEAERMLSDYHPRGVFQQLETGLITDAGFYDYVRAHSRPENSDGQISEALNSFVTGMAAYKLEMLSRLRQKYRVFLLSNTSHVMFPEIEEKCFTANGDSIDYYFERVFLSYEMKMMKPDKGIFEAVLSQAQIEARETLFIDDGPANIESAASLGFQTYTATQGEDLRLALATYL